MGSYFKFGSAESFIHPPRVGYLGTSVNEFNEFFVNFCLISHEFSVNFCVISHEFSVISVLSFMNYL